MRNFASRLRDKRVSIRCFDSSGRLNVFNKARIVVWTDKRIAIFSAGQARWARTQPRKLLSELPLGTRFEPGKGSWSGSWSKVQVGPELIWFSRNTYALFDKANAASS